MGSEMCIRDSVEILGEKPGEHRVKPLPPRFDFFSKHESQY